MDLKARMQNLISPPAPPMILGQSGTTEISPFLSTLSRGVRRAPINDGAIEPGDISVLGHHRVPKTVETHNSIRQSLQRHYLFNALSNNELDEMINVMTTEIVPAGNAIITQGAPGTSFFVLESGKAEIYVDNILVGTYINGDAFGELALLYNCPRAATIYAKTGCTVWSMDRCVFRRIMATTATATQLARVDFLKNVELLQKLNNNQLQKIAAALTLQHFNDGEIIIQQGDIGNSFYIVVEGIVRCTARSQNADCDDKVKELVLFKRGNYFGEMALMLNEPRQASCTAVGSVECYVLDRVQFTKLLGPLRSLIDRQMRIRVLRSVPLLSSLSDDELDLLAHALNVKTFKDSNTILKEGTEGDTFYIISDGRVSVQKSGREVMQLRSGEYFGERALLSHEPRSADCIAIGRVECLTLHRDVFEKLLGKLEHIMERERQRQQMAALKVYPISSPTLNVSNANSLGNLSPTSKKLAIWDLERIRTIGTGTFGRVILVRHRPSTQAFALKCIQKVSLMETHQEKNVMDEKNIISMCNHPFILKLHETFSDRDQLYMLFELVQGGELWSLLYEKPTQVGPKGICGGFDIPVARFYAATVAEALRYLQKLGVAYRDLKPENLVLDSKGYLKVVDFGFAKQIPYSKNNVLQDRSFTLCGTPEYLAPELVLNKGHEKSVDHWALGCLIYELIAGRTPFQHMDQNKIFEKILQGRSFIKFHNKFDQDAKDLILKLLEPNPALRLGSLSGGVQDILDHPFFAKPQFNWTALIDKSMIAPYVPKIKDPFDAQNFDSYPEENAVRPFYGNDIFEGF